MNYRYAPKVASSTVNGEKIEKSKKKYVNLPKGRCISFMEQRHTMLRYSKVHTNMKFIKTQTHPLELRAGVEKSKVTEVEDGAYMNGVSQGICEEKEFNVLRCHTANELLTIQSATSSRVLVDKISAFSICSPELRNIVRNVGDNYRWFRRETTVLKVDKMRNKLNVDLNECCWIDGV